VSLSDHACDFCGAYCSSTHDYSGDSDHVEGSHAKNTHPQKLQAFLGEKESQADQAAVDDVTSP
jgi:hypothetical protein